MRDAIVKESAIKKVLPLIYLIVAAIGLYCLAGRVGISKYARGRVEEGMARSEVVWCVGEPHNIDRDGAWYYRVWSGVLPSSHLIVGFDSEDHVHWVSY